MFQKIWWIEKLALSLHPLSPLKLADAAEVLRNIFEKKVTKKFGGFKNMLYLCNRFPLQKKRERF